MSVNLAKSSSIRPILVCLSHLRWNFVSQRPQHLLTRAASTYQVVFVEEPVIFISAKPDLVVRVEMPNVTVVTPHLPANLDPADVDAVQRQLLDQLLERLEGDLDVVW